MFFGTKKPEGRTLLILDVESGSVGGALVRLTPGEAPKLFGETRAERKISPTRDSLSLLSETVQDLERVLESVRAVASRLRNAPAAPEVQDIGHVTRAAVFLGAPWGAPNLGAGAPSFVEPVADRARRDIETVFGSIPSSLHTAAGAVFAGTRRMMPQEDAYLVCVVNAEVTEIVLIADDAVAGYATIPRGHHSIVRTLRAHADISAEEAFSAMRLADAVYAEPLGAAADEYVQEIAETVERLLTQSPLDVRSVYIVSHGRAEQGESEWFARALSRSERLGELMPQGSVRALGSRHAMPYLSAHAEEPDLMLMLQTIFTGDHL